MDAEIIHKSKKLKLSQYSNSCNLSTKNSIKEWDNLRKSRISSNSILKSNSSNFMCSHETIDVELDVGSTGSSNCWTKHSSGSNMLEKGSFPCESNKKTSEKEEFERMLSLDDYLFADMDMPPHDVLLNKKDEKQKSLVNNLPQQLEISSVPYKTLDGGRTYDLNSPDIFSCNGEGSEQQIDSEDHAWDMSISVNGTNTSLICDENKKSDHTNDVMMPSNLSNIVLDSWESPFKPKDSGSFENRLKQTLASNAHKTIIHQLSPTVKGCIIESNNVEHFFGLPLIVKSLIKKFKGIDKLYEWQEECLRLPAVEGQKNLVYALPTSGGKTLVAEVLVFKEILCREKNVLFVLPYVSIAQEKVRAFSPFAVELGFLVEEYAGSKGAYPPQKRRRKRSVYVATIEKALGLVHSLIESQRIQELGLVVIDELHLIGEPKRGAHLESMLVKLMYLKNGIQIIGMSATIGNLSDIATFLDADVYTQQFRPVQLTEYVKVENELFKVDHSVASDVPLVFHSKQVLESCPKQMQQDPDKIGALVKEVVPEHSCLVFCPSKKNSENVALLICNSFDKGTVEHKAEEKKALYRALLAEGNGNVCAVLKKTLPFGVAYHHSGLTTAERSLLEEAFLAKTVCCICCTSTLAAGVNLPARRVILRSPYIGNQLLTLSRYKQMVGRAGRTGMGDIGESFLICKPQDAQKVGELLSSGMDICVSQLHGCGLEGVVISTLDLSLASSLDSLMTLCRRSLLSIQAATQGVNLDTQVKAAVDRLIDMGALSTDGDLLTLSTIGKAAVKANLDIVMAKQLYTDLKVAQDSLVLLSHLHLLYLSTPYHMTDQIAFQQQPFCSAFMELGAKEVQAARVIGVGEQCIARLMSGRSIQGSLKQVLHRFYLSLILFDLWNETSIWNVSKKYELPRGLVHNLLVSASAFSSSVVRFCEVLDDLWCFKLLLAEMSSRLTHCCNMELIPLMELPAVKIGRAKQLYSAGFKSLSILAKTEPKVLAQAVDHMPKRVAHQIVAAAKLLLRAKAESLQEEAEAVLEGL